MGERVLHRMLPILRETVSSPDAATRQGVCAGLKEVRRRWQAPVASSRTSGWQHPANVTDQWAAGCVSRA